jgi:8-oxo-dGTP diphosphatase
MQWFCCSIANGKPKFLEHKDARWLLPKELQSLNWLEADRELVANLKQILEKKSINLF